MKWVGLVALAAAAFVAAITLGPAHVPLAELTQSEIVRSLRVPRGARTGKREASLAGVE